MPAHFCGAPAVEGQPARISFAMIGAILRGKLDVLLARS
jgi:hypothetical protein